MSIEYLENVYSINKDDIKLYIDLNEISLEDGTCKIKYESTYEIKKINIRTILYDREIRVNKICNNNYCCIYILQNCTCKK